MLLQRFAYSEFARPLFGGRVAMEWADPRAPMPRLIGDEVLAVENAGMALARRFGAGRAAAHAAMAQLGHVARPVLQGAGGAPVWPSGLTGAIAHAPRDSLAVVSDDPEIRALGLKISGVQALGPALWPKLCTAQEMRWLASLGPSQRGHFARLLECLKLASYKARFQLGQPMPCWHEIELEVDLARNQFSATCPQDGGAHRGQGRFVLLSDCYIAGVEWR
jgi:4'-phosphopantetheinyl transferase EntD